MKPRLAMLRQVNLVAVLGAALGLPAVVSAHADTSATVPQSALHACAIIAAASERLACYDQLSGRPAQSAAAPPAPTVAPSAAVAPPAAVTPPAAASTAAPAPPPKQTFGLYAAEHPTPPRADSVQARVVSVGHSASGRMTVTLEGGQLWELDEGDPLLTVGDTVDIRRAALGSFMMETPSKRTHRVRRLL